MALTAMWWWIDRWRKSTAYTDMTAAEQGCYRNLLDEAWLRRGSLPNNDRILSRISGDPRAWKRARTKVLSHFILTPEGWRNTTLDTVLAISEHRADRQARYRNTHNAGHNAGHNGGHNYPRVSGSVSGSGSRTKKKSGAGAPRRNRICPHTPTCATWTECTSLILEEGRRKKAGQ